MIRQQEGFKEIFQDLVDDCIAFDNNVERKAKDIAGRIRTLLKDGPNKNTISILTQLNRKDVLFKDSAIQYTTNPGFSYFSVTGGFFNNTMSLGNVYMGLVYKNVNGSINPNSLKNNPPEFTFKPLFSRDGSIPEIKEKPFNDWWEQIIYEDPFSKYKLSRKDLILSNSEKDGFAHFDEKLNDEYMKFLQSDSLELILNDEKIIFKNNPAKNSIRQIGYEVIETLKQNFNDIITTTNCT